MRSLILAALVFVGCSARPNKCFDITYWDGSTEHIHAAVVSTPNGETGEVEFYSEGGGCRGPEQNGAAYDVRSVLEVARCGH